MCGRFALTTPPDVLARWYALMHRLEFSARYNIAPTQAVLMVKRDAQGRRELVEARWGLVPFWAKDSSIGSKLINARAESALTKPAFRQAMQKRRCLIPASGFYEWKKAGAGKQPYYITRDDGAPFAFAGLWEYWKDPAGGESADAAEGIRSCTILTTAASDAVRDLHDRMPVALTPDQWDQWLDVERCDGNSAMECINPLATCWRIVPVSRAVNSPVRDDPALIEPLKDEVPQETPSEGRSGKRNRAREESLFED